MPRRSFCVWYNRSMKRYFIIAIGDILISLPYVLVMVPQGVINGGVTSLSMSMHRLPLADQLPVSFWVTILTALIALLCYLFLGKDYFLGSLFSCICYVGSFDLFSAIIPQSWIVHILRFSPLSGILSGDASSADTAADVSAKSGLVGDPSLLLGLWIEITVAAIIVGIGYYLCIHAKASTVGMDTIALILHEKNERIPIAPAMYALNILILLLGLYTYGIRSVICGIYFAGIQALTLHILLLSSDNPS